jgi:hypothetical protein
MADDFSEYRLADLPDTARYSVKEWKLMMVERLALLVELGLTNKTIEDVEESVDEFVDNLQPCSALDLLCSPPDPSDTQYSEEDCRRWAYKDALICSAILSWPKIDEDSLQCVLMNSKGWSRYFAKRGVRYQELYLDFTQMIGMLDNCVRKQ